MSESPTELPNPTFTLGERVQVIALPSYVKTAEPIPMLRPPTVIQVGEIGVILGRRPGNTWSVRLERGAYLLEAQYLKPVGDI
jgi:hypothetical protein